MTNPLPSPVWELTPPRSYVHFSLISGREVYSSIKDLRLSTRRGCRIFSFRLVKGRHPHPEDLVPENFNKVSCFKLVGENYAKKLKSYAYVAQDSVENWQIHVEIEGDIFVLDQFNLHLESDGVVFMKNLS